MKDVSRNVVIDKVCPPGLPTLLTGRGAKFPSPLRIAPGVEEAASGFGMPLLQSMSVKLAVHFVMLLASDFQCLCWLLP